MSEKLIYAAMAKVMGLVGVVGKTKKNVQQGYQFRGIDDVMAHVQGVLADCGVICIPYVVSVEREMIQTKSGGTMASVRALIDHTFYASDGSSVVARTIGEAMDSGDKASNKAMSAALKYALTEALMIPTYETQRDTEEASPEIAAPKPAAPVVAVPAPAGGEDPISREVGLLKGLAQLATSKRDVDGLAVRFTALPDGTEKTALGAFLKARKAELK